MNKKYEFTSETLSYLGRSLHRIKAQVDIPEHGVREGDLGGWIEKEANLSSIGGCWVGGEGKVFDKASVINNAIVRDFACVSDQVLVRDSGEISGRARLMGSSQVRQQGKVRECARVCDEVVICHQAIIEGSVIVKHEVLVSGQVRIYGNVVIGGCVALCGDYSFARTPVVIQIPKEEDDPSLSPIAFVRADTGNTYVSYHCSAESFELFKKEAMTPDSLMKKSIRKRRKRMIKLVESVFYE